MATRSSGRLRLGGLCVLLLVSLGCVALQPSFRGSRTRLSGEGKPRLSARRDPPSGPGRTGASAPSSDSILVDRELLRAHNQERAAAKLPTLELNEQLSEAARQHAKAMAVAGVVSHDGPADHSTPSTRISRTGYRFQSVAENVAGGQETVDEVVSDWMNSPGHRRNILGSFVQMGVGRAEGRDGQWYWCVNFATPWPELDPMEQSRSILEQLNRFRAREGAEALKADEILDSIAEQHARALAIEEDLARHDLSPVFEALKARGVSYEKAAISMGSGLPDAEALCDDLMDRADQRKTLLGRFNRLGIGVARRADGSPVWILLLLRSTDE